jgi:hypothetical protein
MLPRLFFWLRYLVVVSDYKKEKSSFACNRYHIEATDTFAVRSELKEDPLTVLGTSLIISIVVFGLMVRDLER